MEMLRKGTWWCVERTILICIASIAGGLGYITWLALALVSPSYSRELGKAGKWMRKKSEASAEEGAIADLVSGLSAENAELALALLDKLNVAHATEIAIVTIPYLIVLVLLWIVCKTFWIVTLPIALIVGFYYFSTGGTGISIPDVGMPDLGLYISKITAIYESEQYELFLMELWPVYILIGLLVFGATIIRGRKSHRV